MVETTKKDVLEYYRGLNASHRVELICALLDHSLPFELRFLGSVIENFGRKDFHILREAENKANSVHSSDSGVPDIDALLSLLAEGPPAPTPPPGHVPLPQPPPPTPMAVPPYDGRNFPPYENHVNQHQNAHQANQMHQSHVEDDQDEEKGKDCWLMDGRKRRKLILYLSLMSATNHDSANLYFVLLSDGVLELFDQLGWMEELEEGVRDEILLLYTVGAHHPAFTFDQRRYLSTILSKFKGCIANLMRWSSSHTSNSNSQAPKGHPPSSQSVNNSIELSMMPGLEDAVDLDVRRPRRISCYNCGSCKHTGPECREASMEEMTKKPYRLNFGGGEPNEGE